MLPSTRAVCAFYANPADGTKSGWAGAVPDFRTHPLEHLKHLKRQGRRDGGTLRGIEGTIVAGRAETGKIT